MFPALLLISVASAEPAMKRLALVAGTNDGGSDRVALRYAESDAEAMARVLEELGGVPREDIVLAFHPPEMRPLTEFAVA